MALVIASASQVAVAGPAADGEGMMSVSPTSVTYGSSGNTFTFTFTANIGDFSSGSQVALTIPAGWTPPTTAAGAGHVTVAAGTATLSGAPPFAITGSTIVIDMASCASGQFFTVTYAGVTAPVVAGSPYPFITQTDIGSGGSGLVDITAGFPAVTVDPTTLTVSAAGLTPDPKIYDGTTNATLVVGTPILVGVIGNDSVSLVTGSAAGRFADKNVGMAKTVTIAGLTLAGANAGNYTLTQPTRTANITRRPITVTAVTETKTYDGTNSAIGVPILSGGTPLAPGDTAPAWTQTFDSRNVGTGKTLTPAGAVMDDNNGLNYAYTFAPNTSGSITAKPITITATTDSKVYDGSTNSSGVPILSGGTPLAPGDVEPVWIQTFDSKNVGTAKTLTPAGKVSDGNGGLNYAYAFVPVTTGVITAKSLTVTATAQSKTYGATLVLNGATDFTASGLQNSETIGSVMLSASGTPAGTAATAAAGPYTITPSAATGGTFTPGNYAITYATGALTVDPAALTVTAIAQSKIYGATLVLNGATDFTATGLQNNETIGSVMLSASGTPAGTTATAAAGPYTITPSAATGGTFTAGNYAITYATGALAVDPAALTVTATAQSKTYGTTLVLNGATNFTATGLQNGETIGSVTLSASGSPAGTTATAAVGPYTITPSAATGGTLTAGNYAITYATGALTVDPAALTVTATAQSKTYGATLVLNGATNFTATGLQNGETIGSVTLSASGSPAGTATTAAVGSYTITPSAATGGTFTVGNYAITYTAGALAVDPAALTVTATAQSKTYGVTMLLFGSAFTSSGLQNSETIGSVTLNTSGTPAGTAATAAAGSYTITPSAATGGTFTAGNYAITYATGTLTVNLAALTVTADSKTKTYGTADPVFTVSYSGFVNSETAAVLGGTLSFARAPGENVGNYLITPSGLTSTNYAISFNTGTLSITPPAPTILSLAVVSPAEVVITWSAVSNGNYRIQFKSDLGATNWTDLNGDVTASGSTAAKHDTQTGTARFYRVQVLP